MIYIFFGPQGSGKSTQAKLLAEKLGIITISSGEVSRKIREENTDEGRYARELYDQGKLLPDNILFGRLKEIFLSPQAAGGFILDGYPRNKGQIFPFELFLKESGKQVDKVVVIDLTDEEGIKRLMLRAKIENRSDDNEGAIKKRLSIYHAETEPIIDYYEKQGKVIHIDGSGTIEEVTGLISKILP